MRLFKPSLSNGNKQEHAVFLHGQALQLGCHLLLIMSRQQMSTDALVCSAHSRLVCCAASQRVSTSAAEASLPNQVLASILAAAAAAVAAVSALQVVMEKQALSTVVCTCLQVLCTPVSQSQRTLRGEREISKTFGCLPCQHVLLSRKLSEGAGSQAAGRAASGTHVSLPDITISGTHNVHSWL